MTPLLAGVFDPADPVGVRRRVAEAFSADTRVVVVAAGPLALAATGPAGNGEGAVSALTGYLTNLDSIRTRLGVSSGRPADVVRELVARGGAQAVGELRGAFVAATWDDSSHRGALATDHHGARGLFHCGDGRRLVFASELSALLRLLPATPPPDEDALVRWLANEAFARGQTLFGGVRRLQGGRLIELGPDGWVSRTYWEPAFSPAAGGTTDEHADAVRLAAEAAVRARLGGNDQTGVLLSGGIDSSSVAALARSGGARLRGYTAVFPDDPAMDESELVALVAESLDLSLTRLVVSGGSMLASSLDYLATWRVPSLSPNLVFAVPLVQAAGADGVSELLDGEGGDELFGFSAYAFADLFRRGRLLAAIRLVDRLPGIGGQPRAKAIRWVLREWGAKGSLPYAVHVAARRFRPDHYGASWLRPPYAARLGGQVDAWEWKRRDGPRWWASLATELTEGRERFGAHDFLRHKSALGGVEGLHPYFEDVDLTQRILSLPPEDAFDPVHDRPLLRRATAGLLPDAVRLRNEKSYFDSLFQRTLLSTDRDALLRLLNRDSAVAQYVRTDVIRGFLEGAHGRPDTWRWIVWRAACAECWLRSLEDEAFPTRVPAEWSLEAPRLETDPAQQVTA